MKEFKDAVTSTSHSPAGDDLPKIHPKAIRPELEQAMKLLKEFDGNALLRSTVGVASPSVSESPVTPLTIDLQGLVSMHDPQKTSILYSAPHDPTERLYPFCLAVQKLFKDAGFLVDDNRELTLHATIMNTIYAKGRAKRPPKNTQRQQTPEPDQSARASAEAPEGPAINDRAAGHGPEADAPLKIDATHLLEQYEDFVWAKDVKLDRIAICEMGAKKITDAEFRVVDEEYKEMARVAIG
ncbi:hypothetical protein LTR78_005107 [Recurvomyces mirabilis]|uniref:A-kinase anchor protein 7-like phosphoesterase domain-containing protein n=1 Tax=Recurvomyces mirabilis TaxID=574656 RepID=A0AAE0WNV1_9PEZI|nr:hypothetical protein LTR78_005107 [Recurvomyces mirabilis]KAK5158278.1 hypothetical protein LTS14_003296 [Recurvomyces mirabilis]